ncbi:hypothetical protein CDES_10270 [Corynebacterium deserti GIMN1.010]|uniref:Uncharacterized protein n=1 Tax=Corynebacterium deserti GIMN1.010 TaxID=931089 RepID=A0A0M4CZ18_9CORY|nr:hypothetical protein [Corynebacterium deserti]ALC06432.1 hypothetical protein CDES_10270 [Corynebacterium deserti GIMN1.010]
MNIVLHGVFRTRQEFFDLLGRAAWGVERPAPTNLDGMVDLLRETGVTRISVRGQWLIPANDAERIEEVCDDFGVDLRLEV